MERLETLHWRLYDGKLFKLLEIATSTQKIPNNVWLVMLAHESNIVFLFFLLSKNDMHATKINHSYHQTWKHLKLVSVFFVIVTKWGVCYYIQRYFRRSFLRGSMCSVVVCNLIAWRKKWLLLYMLIQGAISTSKAHITFNFFRRK